MEHGFNGSGEALIATCIGQDRAHTLDDAPEAETTRHLLSLDGFWHDTDCSTSLAYVCEYLP
jgi:hypothetical protein